VRDLGNKEKALADFTAVIEMPHASAEQKSVSLFNRACMMSQQGRASEALADLDKAITMADAPAEDRADAFWLRGLCRRRQGDPTGMEQDARAALAIASESPEARFVLALALLLTNQTESAKAEYGCAAGQCRKVKDIHEVGIEELEQALKDRGHIQGADEILAMLHAREAELR